jgi:transposase-like protein
MKPIKKTYSSEFKTRVAIELMKEEKTISQICKEFSIHSTQASKWKKQAKDILKEGFGEGKKLSGTDQQELTDILYKEIGKLKIEIEFLKKNIGILG